MDHVPADRSRQDAVQRLNRSSTSHALLLPYPDQGHLNPLMQLGIRLAAQGVQVTFAIPHHVHAKIVRTQLQASAHISHERSAHNLQIVGFNDGLPPGAGMREVKHAFDFTIEEGAVDLIQTLASQGRPVTCIVADLFVRWSRSLAARLALPEFVFWSQAASVLSVYFNVDAINSAGYDPYEGNVRAAAPREACGHVELDVPGLPLPVHPADLPFEFPFEDGLSWLRKMLADRLSRMGEAQGLLCNTFDALEGEAFRALTQRFESAQLHPLYGRCWPSSGSLRLVGPLVPSSIFWDEACKEEVQVAGVSLWQEEVEECKQWLDSQPAASVVFVAFGSMTPISESQVRELAWGLAASGQRFLWVLREHAIRPDGMGDPDKMGESKGGSGERPPPPPPAMPLEAVLPPGFLEETRHLCKLIKWAPQALVLAHPSVGGFFSHCGWNSILETVCSGVPILGWPSMMDQVTNCWLATHVWKVGVTLERNHENQTSKENVEKGVRQLMEGTLSTSMRSRARELALLAHKAYTDRNVISSLVEDMRRASSSSSPL